MRIYYLPSVYRMNGGLALWDKNKWAKRSHLPCLLYQPQVAVIPSIIPHFLKNLPLAQLSTKESG